MAGEEEKIEDPRDAQIASLESMVRRQAGDLAAKDAEINALRERLRKPAPKRLDSDAADAFRRPYRGQ